MSTPRLAKGGAPCWHTRGTRRLPAVTLARVSDRDRRAGRPAARARAAVRALVARRGSRAKRRRARASGRRRRRVRPRVGEPDTAGLAAVICWTPVCVNQEEGARERNPHPDPRTLTYKITSAGVKEEEKEEEEMALRLSPRKLKQPKLGRHLGEPVAGARAPARARVQLDAPSSTAAHLRIVYEKGDLGPRREATYRAPG
ncbi:unnamed protein product [Prorocentrum cordatum]|uniref:Uncharacterized protein n=1 Tax=Prorocentrum cordatum TaxID=2364126 RepID=A0ABN9UZM0_9DINO|nr:unnamed protein product [Polarella glacialis]